MSPHDDATPQAFFRIQNKKDSVQTADFFAWKSESLGKGAPVR